MSRLRIWLQRGVIGILVLLFVGVGIHYLERLVAYRDLQAAEAELDEREPGWRLDAIEQARQRVPPDKNGATVLEAALAKRPKNRNTDDIDVAYHYSRFSLSRRGGGDPGARPARARCLLCRQAGKKKTQQNLP